MCPIVFPRNAKYIYEDGYVDTDTNTLVEYNVCSKNDRRGTYMDFAENFFGLTQDQVGYLFHPWKYAHGRKGPRSVAKRIIHFVKNNGNVNLENSMGGVR